jgi:hypothetical protein
LRRQQRGCQQVQHLVQCHYAQALGKATEWGGQVRNFTNNLDNRRNPKVVNMPLKSGCQVASALGAKSANDQSALLTQQHCWREPSTADDCSEHPVGYLLATNAQLHMQVPMYLVQTSKSDPDSRTSSFLNSHAAMLHGRLHPMLHPHSQPAASCGLYTLLL